MKFLHFMRQISLVFILFLLSATNSFSDYQIKSDDVRVDSSSFIKNLSLEDNTVQKALNTIDNMTMGNTYSASGTLLNLSGNTFSVKEGTLNTTKGCKYISGTGLVCDQDYLTSFTETDPVVKAINGIVKSNGSTISAASAGSDYQAPITAARSLTFTGTTLDADTETYAYVGKYGVFSPVATDDIPDIDYMYLPVTIKEFRCFSDQTVVVQLQRDDGTPANMFTANVTCDSGGGSACASGCDTTLVDAEDNCAATNTIDLVTVSVSGTPTRVTLFWYGEYDD